MFKNHMKLSHKGFMFIESWEKFREDPYNDSSDNCTVGYGHLIHKGPCDDSESEKAMHAPMTEQRATSELWKDAETAMRCINYHVKHVLSQNQFDALVSFAYNLGTGRFRLSELCHYINIADKLNPTIIRQLFNNWDKIRTRNKQGKNIYKISTGLKVRREYEAWIFNSNIYRMHK